MGVELGEELDVTADVGIFFNVLIEGDQDLAVAGDDERAEDGAVLGLQGCRFRIRQYFEDFRDDQRIGRAGAVAVAVRQSEEVADCHLESIERVGDGDFLTRLQDLLGPVREALDQLDAGNQVFADCGCRQQLAFGLDRRFRCGWRFFDGFRFGFGLRCFGFGLRCFGHGWCQAETQLLLTVGQLEQQRHCVSFGRQCFGIEADLQRERAGRLGIVGGCSGIRDGQAFVGRKRIVGNHGPIGSCQTALLGSDDLQLQRQQARETLACLRCTPSERPVVMELERFGTIDGYGLVGGITSCCRSERIAVGVGDLHADEVIRSLGICQGIN